MNVCHPRAIFPVGISQTGHLWAVLLCRSLFLPDVISPLKHSQNKSKNTLKTISYYKFFDLIPPRLSPALMVDYCKHKNPNTADTSAFLSKLKKGQSLCESAQSNPSFIFFLFINNVLELFLSFLIKIKAANLVKLYVRQNGALSIESAPWHPRPNTPQESGYKPLFKFDFKWKSCLFAKLVCKHSFTNAHDYSGHKERHFG